MNSRFSIFSLLFLLIGNACSPKKTDKVKEPVAANQTASINGENDSYNKVSADVRSTLTQFISANQSSSDPVTQKFLALAQETVSKQSDADLSQALSDESFEEKSAVAEYDATTEVIEQGSSVGKNLAITGTALGGIIFLAGVGH